MVSEPKRVYRYEDPAPHLRTQPPRDDMEHTHGDVLVYELVGTYEDLDPDREGSQAGDRDET